MGGKEKEQQQEYGVIREGKPVSRREFLKLAGVAGAAVSVAGGLGGLLAACGGGTTTTTTAQSSTTSSAATGSTAAQTTTTAAAVADVLQCPQGAVSGGTPVYGGILKIIHDQVPTNLGAFWKRTGFADAQLARFAVENLIGLDQHGMPVPQLATSWDVDGAAKTVTFHLRQGVKFQDETDFNAAAAKWNLDQYRNGTAGAALKSVTAVDVLDDYTVRLTLSQIDPLFVQSLSSTNAGRMVSPTFAQAHPDEVQLHPVGTGPFKFDSYVPNVSIKYSKFTDYWQKGLPYLDGVELDIVSDPVVALTSFKSGEGQILYDCSATDAKDLKTAGNTIDTATVSIWGIAGDSKNASSPFANINVRRGIAYALDVPTIVTGVFGGFSPATNQLALQGMTAYNSSIAGYPYDVAKATQLLSSAGITPAHPWKTTFSYPGEPDATELYTVVQSYLAKVGIDITLDPLQFPAMNAKVSAPWHNSLVNMNFSYNGIEMQYSTSLMNNLSPDATSFVSVETPDAFNTLYDQMQTTDPSQREPVYQQLTKILIDDDCTVVPIYGMDILTAKAPTVHGSGFAQKTSGEFLPETAWLSK